MFYQPIPIQIPGNRVAPSGVTAAFAYRPGSDPGESLGSAAIAARASRDNTMMSTFGQGSAAAVGYATSLLNSTQQSLASLGAALDTNQTRKDIYSEQNKLERDIWEQGNKNRKTGLLVSGAAGVADFFLNKPKKTERAPLPQFQMPQVPSFG